MLVELLLWKIMFPHELMNYLVPWGTVCTGKTGSLSALFNGFKIMRWSPACTKWPVRFLSPYIPMYLNIFNVFQFISVIIFLRLRFSSLWVYGSLFRLDTVAFGHGPINLVGSLFSCVMKCFRLIWYMPSLNMEPAISLQSWFFYMRNGI